MSEVVTLYDIPTKGSKPVGYSLYTWRTRSLLNFKGIPYKTEWLEIADIAKTSKSLGIASKRVPEDDYVAYTCPILQLRTGECIMDSQKIAEVLERAYPQPSSRVDAPETQRTHEIVYSFLIALSPVFVYRIPDRLVNPKTAEYLLREREKMYGMSVYEVAKHPDFGGEAAWTKAEPYQRTLLELLSLHPEGPFLQGKDAIYADLILASWWKFLSRLDENGDLFGRMLAYDQKFRDHEKACEKWFERED